MCRGNVIPTLLQSAISAVLCKVICVAVDTPGESNACLHLLGSLFSLGAATQAATPLMNHNTLFFFHRMPAMSAAISPFLSLDKLHCIFWYLCVRMQTSHWCPQSLNTSVFPTFQFLSSTGPSVLHACTDLRIWYRSSSMHPGVATARYLSVLAYLEMLLLGHENGSW
jgi:hypothetical protein